jgi:hypothetical protein
VEQLQYGRNVQAVVREMPDPSYVKVMVALTLLVLAPVLAFAFLQHGAGYGTTPTAQHLLVSGEGLSLE